MKLRGHQLNQIAAQITYAAHHEAGHAVACAELGVPFDYVRLDYHLDFRADGTEYPWVDGVVHGDDAHDPDVELVVLAAGAVGSAFWQWKTDGGSVDQLIAEHFNDPRARPDMAAAHETLQKASIRWNAAISEAEWLVRRNWRNLARVATELMHKDHLDERHVRRLAR